MFPLIVDRMKFLSMNQLVELLPMIRPHYPYQLYDAYQ